MTIAQVRAARPRLTGRQRRGAVLAGLVSGAALALESVLLGVYLAGAGFAIADGDHEFGASDVIAAVLAVLLLIAACLLPWLILRRHGVPRSGAIAATGTGLSVVVWLLLSVVAGALGFVAAYATMIVVWGDSLFGSVLVVAVAGVGILVIGIAMPMFLGLAKAFQPRPTRAPEPRPAVALAQSAASPAAPGQPPAPPGIRL